MRLKTVVIDGIETDLKINDDGPIGYLTISEFAKKHDRSQRQIRRYLNESRIEGAIRYGNRGDWFIPEDSKYPEPISKSSHKSWKKDAKDNKDPWIK